MKTLKNVLITIAALIPLAELLFLPVYLAHRTSQGLAAFSGSYREACGPEDGSCNLPDSSEEDNGVTKQSSDSVR